MYKYLSPYCARIQRVYCVCAAASHLIIARNVLLLLFQSPPPGPPPLTTTHPVEVGQGVGVGIRCVLVGGGKHQAHMGRAKPHPTT